MFNRIIVMTHPKIIENPPYFDEEEEEIVEAFEKALDEGKLVSVLTPERVAEMQVNARYTMELQQASLAALVPERDLSRFREKAMERGLSYQALLGSIVHQYVEGQLVEKR